MIDIKSVLKALLELNLELNADLFAKEKSIAQKQRKINLLVSAPFFIVIVFFIVKSNYMEAIISGMVWMICFIIAVAVTPGTGSILNEIKHNFNKLFCREIIEKIFIEEAEWRKHKRGLNEREMNLYRRILGFTVEDTTVYVDREISINESTRIKQVNLFRLVINSESASSSSIGRPAIEGEIGALSPDRLFYGQVVEMKNVNLGDTSFWIVPQQNFRKFEFIKESAFKNLLDDYKTNTKVEVNQFHDFYVYTYDFSEKDNTVIQIVANALNEISKGTLKKPYLFYRDKTLFICFQNSEERLNTFSILKTSSQFEQKIEHDYTNFECFHKNYTAFMSKLNLLKY